MISWLGSVTHKSLTLIFETVSYIKDSTIIVQHDEIHLEDYLNQKVTILNSKIKL